MDYTMYYSSGQDGYLARDVVDYMLVHRKPTEPDAVKEWITQGDVEPSLADEDCSMRHLNISTLWGHERSSWFLNYILCSAGLAALPSAQSPSKPLI